MTLRTFNISNIGNTIVKSPEIIVRHQKSNIIVLINALNAVTITLPIMIVRHQIQSIKNLVSLPATFSVANTQQKSMFWS